MGSPGIEFVRRGDRGLKGREGRKIGKFQLVENKFKRMPK